MGALGLLSVSAGIVLIRAAISGQTPIEVITDFLDRASVAQFAGWGGGGGFTTGGGGGSSWGATPPPVVPPRNVI